MASKPSTAAGPNADWRVDPAEESQSPSTSSTSIIAKYISRFRSAPPTAPVIRGHDKTEVKEFWWLSEEQLEKQERRLQVEEHFHSFESGESTMELSQQQQQHDVASTYLPPPSPPSSPSAASPSSSSSSLSPRPPLRPSSQPPPPSRPIVDHSVEQFPFEMLGKLSIERPGSISPPQPSRVRIPDLDRRVDDLLALADQVILSYRGAERGDPTESWDSTMINTRESLDTASSVESLSPLQFTRRHGDERLSMTSSRPTWASSEASSEASSPASSLFISSEARMLLSLREGKEEQPSPVGLSSSGQSLPPLSPVRSPTRRAPPVSAQMSSSPHRRSLQEEMDSGSLCLSSSSMSSSGIIFSMLPARQSAESTSGCAVEVTEAMVRPFLHDDLIRQLWQRLCIVNQQLQQLDGQHSDQSTRWADS